MKMPEEVIKYCDRIEQELPTRIRCLIRAARSDLYEGPLESYLEGGFIKWQYEDGSTEKFAWPGFVAACREIGNALNLPDIYHNRETGEVSESEPTGYQDEETGEWIDESEDWYLFDSNDLKREILGRELAHHI
jgi:hypothetical protein